METRVERLEAEMSEMMDVRAIRSDLQYIKGRLDALPTTIQLAGFVIAIFLAASVTRFL